MFIFESSRWGLTIRIHEYIQYATKGIIKGREEGG